MRLSINGAMWLLFLATVVFVLSVVGACIAAVPIGHGPILVPFVVQGVAALFLLFTVAFAEK